MASTSIPFNKFAKRDYPDHAKNGKIARAPCCGPRMARRDDSDED